MARSLGRTGGRGQEGRGQGAEEEGVYIRALPFDMCQHCSRRWGRVRDLMAGVEGRERDAIQRFRRRARRT
jgi:hypothetical protein